MNPLNQQTVWRVLAEVMDPELPISVVDMGLIYDVRVNGGAVDIDMTFTAMACPAMTMMIDDICAKINALTQCSGTRVHVVWNPPWTKARLSERGRAVLQSMGIAV